MKHMNLHKQIAFLRKQKGMTQEEMAVALGVTNQSVSKWENGQNCPDIQLLPDIAALFDVSIDELMGHQPVDELGNIQLKMRRYFEEQADNAAFEKVYRIAALLHEIAVTDGYKRPVPWKLDRDYTAEKPENWGTSICAEDDGSTGRISGSLFFAWGGGYVMPTTGQALKMQSLLSQLNDADALRVFCAVHALTWQREDAAATQEALARKTGLSGERVAAALDRLPVKPYAEEEETTYRLDDDVCHIPPLLSFFVL